ncbi:MAG TPA: hypothetical protein VGO66_04590 [Solirubrobacterales bacterium]|jgi:hypothetical protein|nr:hypothetical protein [Solirubrobacterales bacterium]
MSNRSWVGVGCVVTLLGAILVFALDDPDASLLGVSLKPLGGVLLGAGVVLVIGLAIGSMGNNGDSQSFGHTGDLSSIKAIAGLIAVVTGVGAVAGLAAFTLTQLGDAEESSTVAISSSAFGVISAVIGAYLGIKVSTDQSSNATAEARHAAVAQHEANVANQKLQAVTDKVKEVAPTQAEAIKEAVFQAGEEARVVEPPRGSGNA